MFKLIFESRQKVTTVPLCMWDHILLPPFCWITWNLNLELVCEDPLLAVKYLSISIRTAAWGVIETVEKIFTPRIYKARQRADPWTGRRTILKRNSRILTFLESWNKTSTQIRTNTDWIKTFCRWLGWFVLPSVLIDFLKVLLAQLAVCLPFKIALNTLVITNVWVDLSTVSVISKW